MTIDSALTFTFFKEKTNMENGKMYVVAHRYKKMTPEMRPQDPTLDGSTMTFETLEHGGDEIDEMPQAIKVTDEEGRWCIYVPISGPDGQPVQSHGYDVNCETGAGPAETGEGFDVGKFVPRPPSGGVLRDPTICGTCGHSRVMDREDLDNLSRNADAALARRNKMAAEACPECGGLKVICPDEGCPHYGTFHSHTGELETWGEPCPKCGVDR